MAYCYMAFLYPGGVCGGNDQETVCMYDHRLASGASHPNSSNALIPGSFHGPEHILRPAGSRQTKQHISASASGFYHPFINSFKAIIIGHRPSKKMYLHAGLRQIRLACRGRTDRITPQRYAVRQLHFLHFHKKVPFLLPENRRSFPPQPLQLAGAVIYPLPCAASLLPNDPECLLSRLPYHLLK